MPLPDPEARARRPLRQSDFADWTTYYWTYQHEFARSALLPCLRDWGVWRDGIRILDVGCGDGGATCALAESGAAIHGIDIESRRLRMGRERAAALGMTLELAVADITDESTLGGFEGPYDLVLFRDVLEHIPDVEAALVHSAARLGPGGGILVIYPPYWSAYGGHQQILRSPRRIGLRWAKLPFAHWLPVSWWRVLAGPDEEWEELLTIRRARLTLSRMHQMATAQGLRPAHRRRYLLRPSFRLRYGSPVLGAGLLDRLPGLREVVVSASWELFVRD